ncbi:30S ribosomal protein S6e [Candidatus Woesearchaeota archaeon]|nr:30S ribosomal protein S6e [Candidatus Woesearchaeota archaeon]
MASFKIVISSPESGLSVQREIKDDAAKGFLGLKIGDAVKGELVDLQGYEFVLTGGSDFCGFPMRRDVVGVGRRKILAYEGVGVKRGERGMLQRKTVCGNTVHAKTAQVNLKVIKGGKDNIFAEAEKKASEKKAEKDAKKSGSGKAAESEKTEAAATV